MSKDFARVTLFSCVKSGLNTPITAWDFEIAKMMLTLNNLMQLLPSTFNEATVRLLGTAEEEDDTVPD